MKRVFMILIISLIVLLASCSKNDMGIDVINCDYYENFNVSFLGDSITDLCKKESYGYIQYLSNHFKFKKVNNYGISGTTISNSTRHDAFYQDERVDMVDIDSDLIFIYGGINDQNCNYPIGNIDSVNPNELCGAYNVLIDKIKTRFNAEIIFIIPHVINEDDFYDYCDAIKDVAIKNNLDYVDLFNDSGITTQNIDEYTIGWCTFE